MGGGHSYYLLALRLLDHIALEMEATTERKMEGARTPAPQPLDLG